MPKNTLNNSTYKASAIITNGALSSWSSGYSNNFKVLNWGCKVKNHIKCHKKKLYKKHLQLSNYNLLQQNHEHLRNFRNVLCNQSKDQDL